ncbi:MAG: hypothetical protein C0601_10645 [Candidatus Muiribacterium halophilum]|uniref:Methyltransferase type 11 domain-containing protein n=1 Tax=Muiribacterium halophilum TaxID=2053465 RepID=A0A2N5ZC46_MUIH1|nr:MAG: hypothetical protein C0601_10645 [Candidatus Muirbacterium halophilum]
MKKIKNEDYIHFYGSDHKDLFEIERKAMDRDALVIKRLDELLPNGRVVDIGAGNGYTASRLTKDRIMTCVEPSTTMPNFDLPVNWVWGTAEKMPFHDNYFDAAYSTWAYFLPGVDKTKGLAEVKRVVKKDGLIIVVDNAGEDEFCSFADSCISSDKEFYEKNGFSSEMIKTSFRFDSLKESKALMWTFFGKEKMKDNIKLEYEYKVIIYSLKV